jgi:hypothetical protein
MRFEEFSDDELFLLLVALGRARPALLSRKSIQKPVKLLKSRFSLRCATSSTPVGHMTGRH